MDDGLILNLALDVSQPTRPSATKGGRWTDRMKAKRVAKRKTREYDVPTQRSVHTQKVYESLGDTSPRPTKRPRKDDIDGKAALPVPTRFAPASSHSAQKISSLFTSNPQVKVESSSVAQINTMPSNAPLTDKSTFSGLGLNPLINSHLSVKMNITKPTSIQREALPPLLSSSQEEAFDRDVFISSQTGSGKTLSFLLPILQDLLPLSSLSYIDRSIGTLALIIAPTRELAKQISDVLETLLTLRLRPQDESPDEADPSSTRLTRWLVSGLLTGGATRTHEKARLRKGIPILVSTPGRLLDHLQNTSSFNVGKCRWLVLDEADRLMELGFEETITGILKALDGRRKLAMQAVEEEKSMEVGGWDWKRRRRTILCSATMKEDVQHLAGMALTRPIVVKAIEADKPSKNNDINATPGSPSGPLLPSSTEKFTPPSQLTQKHIVVPLKLRLVTLIALLRTLLAHAQGRQGTKMIVFLSCTDSVDFHWRLLGSSSIDDTPEMSQEAESETDDEEPVALRSPLLPETLIFRLHGSLPLATRLASLKGFANAASKSKTSSSQSSSILLCTSVASRGLDLPLVRAVIQYDLPTEGGATEYVHRVGRTARVGKGGEAWSFVAPCEQEWVKWIQDRLKGSTTEGNSNLIQATSVESLLRHGFGGEGKEYKERATEVQLSFERWALKRKENGGLARKAFQSYMRAYATHPSNEKHIFHVRNLHIGHLAKAFALRESPRAIGGGPQQKSSSKTKHTASARRTDDRPTANAKGRHRDWEEEHDNGAEKRMREAVRAQGRLAKKGGVMMTSGASEFHIPGGHDLEKLIMGR